MKNKKLIGDKNINENEFQTALQTDYLTSIIECNKQHIELVKLNRAILDEYKKYNATMQRIEAKIENIERLYHERNTKQI
jgi:hypothetical protein